MDGLQIAVMPGPKRVDRFARDGVAEIRRQLRQRHEHEVIAGNVGSRYVPLRVHSPAIAQEIDIQGTRGEPIFAPAPTGRRVQFFDEFEQTGNRSVRVSDRDQIEKGIAFKPNRLGAVDGRQRKIGERTGQRSDGGTEIALRLDVASEPKTNLDQEKSFADRSMSTPTSLDPRIAPGLFTETRTQGTSNSVTMILAIVSAKVSTS